MNNRDEQCCNLNLIPGDNLFYQDRYIPCKYVICSYRVYAVADLMPFELCYKCEVELLYKAYVIRRPVYTLTIYRYMLCNPSLGGLSQICVSLKMYTLYHASSVVKLKCEGGPPWISVLMVKKATNGGG